MGSTEITSRHSTGDSAAMMRGTELGENERTRGITRPERQMFRRLSYFRPFSRKRRGRRVGKWGPATRRRTPRDDELTTTTCGSIKGDVDVAKTTHEIFTKGRNDHARTFYYYFFIRSLLGGPGPRDEARLARRLISHSLRSFEFDAPAAAFLASYYGVRACLWTRKYHVTTVYKVTHRFPSRWHVLAVRAWAPHSCCATPTNPPRLANFSPTASNYSFLSFFKRKTELVLWIF